MPVRMVRSLSFRSKQSRSLRAGVTFTLLALTPLGLYAQQKTADGKPAASHLAQSATKWLPVSDALLKQLAADGKKIGYPGGTAGVCVDRGTGDVNMIVPDMGIWRRLNAGATFTRLDDGFIGGRCETGSALHVDPGGQRLACFMLDGQSGMTLDNGKTWSAFQQHGRGWDFGAVDWSQAIPKDILAIHHESGGELHRSADGGKSWQLLGKDFTAVGIFDSNAYVASKGSGILRSTDGGTTWTKVSSTTPTGRVLCVVKGVGYWLTTEGLLVSKDRGATWHLQGSALEAAWGPFFGKNEQEIVVGGRKSTEAGLWQTKDAGKTWKLVAPFPEFGGNTHPDWTPSKQWAAGWFFNFGWDWKNSAFYVSRMGNPTLRFTQK